MEGANGTLDPVAEFSALAVATGDLVADPDKEYACEKDQEPRENEPGELHANHGWRGAMSEPQWKVMKPHSVCGFPERVNVSVAKIFMAARSRGTSPED